MRYFFLLLSTLLGYTAFSETPKEVFQKSYYHGANEYDSVVVRKPSESDLPYYTEIEIFRKGKSLLKYSEKSMEVEAHPGVVFTEFGDWDDLYYVFRYNDRPSPDKFIVIRIENGIASKIGITANSTSDIFGDIDCDGIFEIGGKSDWNSTSIFVFEIQPDFPCDTTLTLKLNEVCKEKLKQTNKLNN